MSFASGGLQRPASILDAGEVRLVTSGRIAIALALREIGVQAGDKVLLPAYHSKSMVAPVTACGALPVFYQVGPDGMVDTLALAAALDAGVKAVIVTSYFGFPQALAPIRAWCDAQRVALIEDCAHCFFGSHGGRTVGSWGDYAIASSMKFFPIYEGGALVSARHRLTTPVPHSAGIGFEAKAALNALEHSFAYRRLPLVAAALWLPLQLKALLWRLVKRGATAPLTPSSSDSSYDFDPRWLDKRSSLFSRLVLARVPHGAIVARRRANYLALAAALSALPGCRPLHAHLPDEVCPWLFPLVVDDPEPLFARLHGAGVPMTRFADTLWPGVDAAVCANSAYLSRHVLGFPCHQELRPDELAWMIATIGAAVRA